eukprot:Blabericola_migrator_1__8389@NODE_436_length_8493_cov_87_644434_g342_i0_p4_GENE_NODE_436_length_8493_cov_87_644434_g342_i0NODE_436_length_8493_cov_87_644434_g342_i0_p4_ORF_typecomplete_len245_score31_29_NODE_436_length_8493_cov_87_644434_g342_i019222656
MENDFEVRDIRQQTADPDLMSDLITFDFIGAMTVMPLCADIMSPFVPLVEACLHRCVPDETRSETDEFVKMMQGSPPVRISGAPSDAINGPGCSAALHVFGVLMSQMPSCQFERLGPFLLRLSDMIWHKFQIKKLRMTENYLCFLLGMDIAILLQLDWSFCQQGVWVYLCVWETGEILMRLVTIVSIRRSLAQRKRPLPTVGSFAFQIGVRSDTNSRESWTAHGSYPGGSKCNEKIFNCGGTAR